MSASVCNIGNLVGSLGSFIGFAAAAFMPAAVNHHHQRPLNPHAKSFVPRHLNPNAKEFLPKTPPTADCSAAKDRLATPTADCASKDGLVTPPAPTVEQPEAVTPVMDEEVALKVVADRKCTPWVMGSKTEEEEEAEEDIIAGSVESPR